MVLQCLNLSLIPLHCRQQLHRHQQLHQTLAVNPPSQIFHLTLHILGTSSMLCPLAHLVPCLTIHLMGWAWLQTPREALHLARILQLNRQNHQLVQLLHHPISCLITLTHHCIQDNSLGVEHRDTQLALHQMLFLIHF